MSGKRFHDITWVNIDDSLPCGMGGCERSAHYALVERDPAFEGLWQLLPICDSCRVDRQEPAATARTRRQQGKQPGVAQGAGRG